MYFCPKTLKPLNVPSVRYKMISHHVQVVKQHIRLYQLQLLMCSNCYFLLMSAKYDDALLFSDFLRQKINFVIMTYLQTSFQLNWLNISPDGEVNIPPFGIGLRKLIIVFCRLLSILKLIIILEKKAFVLILIFCILLFCVQFQN